MCGIAGFLGAALSPRDFAPVLSGMAARLRHRGPDGDGVWWDAEAALGLAHTRLAIIDVSAAGRQPMLSHSGRYAVCYNGEIYNAETLRTELDQRNAREWKGHSDTEVLAACFDEYGVAKTLPKLDAMFAFAVWDRATRELTLARDRFGEKPLYYGWVGEAIVFASDLNAFLGYPGFAAEIERDAILPYLRYGYVPAPLSIYAGVRKLEPGVSITVSREHGVLRREQFWNAHDAARAAADQTQAVACDTDALETLMRASVRRRMVSDVPIGCLLSGGIDSSLVAALMQLESPTPIRTFHLRAAAHGFDESEHADTVARAIGSDHHVVVASAAQCLSAAHNMSAIYSEPFADSSQIATYLISGLAACKVKVALSGDGGDELFGGYNRHVHNLWPRLQRVPLSLRRALSASARGVAPALIDVVATDYGSLLPGELRAGRASTKLAKLAAVAAASNERDYVERLISLNRDPTRLSPDHTRDLLLSELADAEWTMSERMMLLDTTNYLPDDILVKTDRASMAHGLELRSPFLCPAVYEFAWRLPLSEKIAHGSGKRPLRKLLSKYVPASVLNRAKQGFAIPIATWLRGELRDWAGDLLHSARVSHEAILAPCAVQALWQEHQSGRADHSSQLWTLVMLQAWLERRGAGALGPATTENAC
jgi:asparagine synthase (glutamine-hydrolysing)